MFGCCCLLLPVPQEVYDEVFALALEYGVDAQQVRQLVRTVQQQRSGDAQAQAVSSADDLGASGSSSSGRSDDEAGGPAAVPLDPELAQVLAFLPRGKKIKANAGLAAVAAAQVRAPQRLQKRTPAHRSLGKLLRPMALRHVQEQRAAASGSDEDE